MNYNEDLWIGMNDVNSEMHFLWTDGKRISYTNWAKGQPLKSYEYMDEVISASISKALLSFTHKDHHLSKS